MSIYAHIKRCLELSDRDIVSAVADRRLTKALLDQLAKVSRPGDGAPKLLLVFAKMAASGVDWIDGALRVEMVGDADVTVVEVLSELGLGMHERVFPSFKMSVPLEEFARAVERVPHMIAPLAIATATGRRLVLTAILEEEEEEGAAPTPAVSIGDDSLYAGGPRRRTSKDKIAAVKDPGTRIQPRTISSAKFRAARRPSKPALDAVKPRVISPTTGKTLRPGPPTPETPAKSAPPPKQRTGPPPIPASATPATASPARIAPAPPPAQPPPAAAPKSARAPLVPRPPALPRTDERTPAPGPSPTYNRAVVAKVPLTRIQAPRPPSPAVADKAQPPARQSKHPKRASMKPAAPAKGQSKPPDRRSKTPPPRSVAPKSSRGRAPATLSEPPDEEGIDLGWDETNKE